MLAQVQDLAASPTLRRDLRTLAQPRMMRAAWQRLLSMFEAADAQWRDPRLDAGWKPLAAVLALSGLCLFGIHYLKYASTLLGVIDALAGADALRAFRASPWHELLTHLWWGAVHLIGYVLVPVWFVRRVWRRPLVDFGLGWGDTTRWLPACAAMVAVVGVFAFIASHAQSFQHTYPFYSQAGRSWPDLLLWELIYLAQFVMLEFFFRGFLLHALAPRFGAGAIFVMVVPYLMIHFPKPWAEAFGALPFGILLGVIALRSRSIWGGALVHMGIALCMDLMSLAQTGRWPASGWPA